MEFAKYGELGRVLFIGDVPQDMLALQGERTFIGRIDPVREYVRDGKACPRPANPARLDGLHLRALPAPCVVVINGKRYDCAEAEAELSFTYPGKYRVRVEAFPWMDVEFTVEV
ncbi:hypothetical protein V8J88_07545 [Massilia sp. W12]|uniref:hypothetical protein n=1 Tax=Massilia sp. W12 TaxID=3126507 RepID=UPI0030D21929